MYMPMIICMHVYQVYMHVYIYLYVCMYVCMYVACTYICIYVCVVDIITPNDISFWIYDKEK